MKSGSTSIERHADTHTPQWMQAIACVTSNMASAGTMYSCPSGGSSAGTSHGTTRRTFFQCTASMSVTRSLTTGMLPIGPARPAPPAAALAGLPHLRVAGEPRAPVDAPAAGAADRGAARAADRDRGVL